LVVEIGTAVRLLKIFVKDRRGASAVEYALILAIIGGAIVLAAIALGVSITGSMNRASTEMMNCGGGC
jgi:pilus assembly protein Flp/PilA